MAQLDALQSTLAQSGIHPLRILIPQQQHERLTFAPMGTPQGEEAFSEWTRRHTTAENFASVLYVMLSNRRMNDNASLAVATLAGDHLRVNVCMIEQISCSAPWMSSRTLSFLLDGVAERLGRPGYACHLSSQSSEAFSFLRPQKYLIVADWCPMAQETALMEDVFTFARKTDSPLIFIDDCGIVPAYFYTKPEAAGRFLKKKIAPFLDEALTERKAIEQVLKKEKKEREAENGLNSIISARHVKENLLLGNQSLDKKSKLELLQSANVSLSVTPVDLPAGEKGAQRTLREFVNNRLTAYAEERNHPDASATSHLSPYLRHGMIHPRTICGEVYKKSQTNSLQRLVSQESGAGRFLDELTTWRELGINMARFAYDANIPSGDPRLIPEWAAKTLRQFLPQKSEVSVTDMEEARTPDVVWNAAQQELRQTGTIHNYMRMLWGKGIVRWSKSPEDALATLEYLNNKYAVDGCDFNSYTGILWCLGKFDRPWPPAREPFGLVRSMSTAQARKKLRMEEYLKKYRPRL